MSTEKSKELINLKKEKMNNKYILFYTFIFNIIIEFSIFSRLIKLKEVGFREIILSDIRKIKEMIGKIRDSEELNLNKFIVNESHNQSFQILYLLIWIQYENFLKEIIFSISNKKVPPWQAEAILKKDKNYGWILETNLHTTMKEIETISNNFRHNSNLDNFESYIENNELKENVSFKIIPEKLIDALYQFLEIISNERLNKEKLDYTNKVFASDNYLLEIEVGISELSLIIKNIVKKI